MSSETVTADFENQGAHRLAKLHDPHGKRTIGKCSTIILLLSVR